MADFSIDYGNTVDIEVIDGQLVDMSETSELIVPMTVDDGAEMGMDVAPELNVVDLELDETMFRPGTTDHSMLINRDMMNQHPIRAISNLETELSGKVGRSEYQAISDSEINNL